MMEYTKMRFGSVCSGIEAASVAWKPLGWEAAWFSEIEPFPSAVLAHHYPESPNLGDMTTLPERIKSGEVEAPDVFCGGTPCQAFSVAGLRKSLADARGNLSLTFCEIADAIDSVRSVRGQPATIVFWENVPGVLSTPDNAFGCFLAQLCGGDEPLVAPDGWPDAGCVDGPKRTVAWRVLDAQYFGLAQRRRRVFVVASARDDFDPAAVLFEFYGVRRDTAPSRETGQGAAKCLTTGIGKRFDAETDTFVPGSLCARTGRSISVQDAAQGHMVTHTLRGEGFDASEDGAGRGTPLVPMAFGAKDFGADATKELSGTLRCGGKGGGANWMAVAYAVRTANTSANGHGVAQEVSHTLDQAQGQAVVQPLAFGVGEEPNLAHCLRSGASKADKHESTTYVAQPIAFGMDGDIMSGAVMETITTREGGITDTSHAVLQPIPIDTMNHIGRKDSHSMGDFEPGAPSYTLTKGHSHAVAHPIGFGAQMSVPQVDVDLMQTLQAKNPMAVAHPVAFTRNDNGRDAVEGVAPTMRVAGRAGGTLAAAMPNMAVRRLTPVECERLQGFPDGYTAIPWRGKPVDECPDGPRYKALGNSWAVPVVRWIGSRIHKSLT